MQRRSQQQFAKTPFFLAFLLAVALMVIDVKTDWLHTPRQFFSTILSPVQIVASIPASLSNTVSRALTSEPSVKIAYENLRKEYFQLKADSILLRNLQQENTKLRELLGAESRLKTELTLAKLIEVNIDPYNHRVLVNRGLSHGVYNGQVVIDDKGVVGQVIEALPLYSSVMLITDPGHVMPIEVQRNGLRTTVHGTGNASQMELPYLNQNADIQVNDLLLSSGLGSRFPKGYPVARVTEVKKIKGGAFLQVFAQPVTGLRDSNYVLLLSYIAPQKEVTALEPKTSDNPQGATTPDANTAEDLPAKEQR